MQDDVTWGVKYLVAEGIADPKRVGILGGSYGGYATLAGVAFTPDLYAAAVDIVGPSNLITLLESIPPYWEAARKTFAVRMGDREHAGRQGAADGALAAELGGQDQDAAAGGAGRQRPARQPARGRADRDCAARSRISRWSTCWLPMKATVSPGRSTTWRCSWSRRSSSPQHLGGRYQEGGSPESVARLKEITVDPKTVVLAKNGGCGSRWPSQAGRRSASPAPAHYQVTIEMGGQQMNLKLTTTIQDSGSVLDGHR